MIEQGPIKFAIVGNGRIGKKHAEMIIGNPEAELVAICDIKPTGPEKEAGDKPLFTSLHDLFSSGLDFDVLSIATPNGLHAEHALLGLEHKKHVVIEKPMALKRVDCERIISRSFQVSRQVFCVMQNRYSPPSQWLKQIISDGVLGNIFMVQVNCYWNRDEGYYKTGEWKGKLGIDGGTLFTQFAHFVDMLYWLFGDIKDIQAKFNNFNHAGMIDFEDSGIVNFNFLNGAMGSINYSTSVWGQNMESSMIIVAEKGSVKVGGQYMNSVEYCHVRDYVMPKLAESQPANDYGTYKGSASNHRYIYENVIETLKNRNTITTNALEGMKVVEIIERIYEQNPWIKK